jgi:hypothetical protein
VKDENGNRRENVKFINTLIRVVVRGILSVGMAGYLLAHGEMAGSRMGLIT